jgi:hypothetical protein
MDLERAMEFQRTATGYAVEQGTRPSTLGLVLSSSPVALLAWYLPFILFLSLLSIYSIAFKSHQLTTNHHPQDRRKIPRLVGHYPRSFHHHRISSPLLVHRYYLLFFLQLSSSQPPLPSPHPFSPLLSLPFTLLT